MAGQKNFGVWGFENFLIFSGGWLVKKILGSGVWGLGFENLGFEKRIPGGPKGILP